MPAMVRYIYTSVSHSGYRLKYTSLLPSSAKPLNLGEPLGYMLNKNFSLSRLGYTFSLKVNDEDGNGGSEGGGAGGGSEDAGVGEMGKFSSVAV